MNKIIARLREPSTYAGIAALFASIGLAGLSEDQWTQVLAAVPAVLGAVAVFLKDPGSSE